MLVDVDVDVVFVDDDDDDDDDGDDDQKIETPVIIMDPHDEIGNRCNTSNTCRFDLIARMLKKRRFCNKAASARIINKLKNKVMFAHTKKTICILMSISYCCCCDGGGVCSSELLLMMLL